MWIIWFFMFKLQVHVYLFRTLNFQVHILKFISSSSCVPLALKHFSIKVTVEHLQITKLSIFAGSYTTVSSDKLWCLFWAVWDHLVLVFIPTTRVTVNNVYRESGDDKSQCSQLVSWVEKLYKIQTTINTLRPRQNGRHFVDDIFKCIFFNENVWIPTNISLRFVAKGPINNIPALVQIMAWRRPGERPLSEQMMVRLPTHICNA